MFRFPGTTTTANPSPFGSASGAGLVAAPTFGSSFGGGTPAGTSAFGVTPQATGTAFGAFGQQQQQPTGFGLGATPGTGTTFGTPTQQQQPTFATPGGGFGSTGAFGTVGTPTTGSAFGSLGGGTATGVAPSFGSLGGFGGTFGAGTGTHGSATTAAPSAFGFGAQGTTGVVAPLTAFGAPAAGTVPTSAFGAPVGTAQLSFGVNPASPFGAGTAATGGAASSFGNFGSGGGFGFGAGGTPTAATTASSSAFGFGAPSTTATVAPITGFGVGTPAASTTSTFGAPLSFGLAPVATAAPTASTTQATTGGTPFSFGLQTAAAPTAAATTALPFTFGQSNPAITTAVSGTTTTTAFSFGTPITSTAAAMAPITGGLGMTATTSAPTTTTAPMGLNFGFGTPIAGAASTVTTTAQQQPTTSVAFTGLGGSHASSGTGIAGLSGTAAKPEGRAVLDLPVPPEIVQVVEELKNHIKNHKIKMQEVSRITDKAIERVEDEIEETRLQVANLSTQVHRQTIICGQLMKEVQGEMKNLDMAMVTKDTPFALQHEITAPTIYFANLIVSYQERMLSYKREIERSESILTSLGQGNAFLGKDLSLALKGTKEMVIALAAKVQDLHEEVGNELAINRNLQRMQNEGGGDEFATEGGGGRASTVSGGSVHGLHPSGSESLVGPQYDQAYGRLNAFLHSVNQRSTIGLDSTLYQPPTTYSSPPHARPSGMGLSGTTMFMTNPNSILSSPQGSLKRSKH